jgi:NADPH-dependent 2,4-dienoyl-CoA reductase/sulfur reductase-like enzyme
MTLGIDEVRMMYDHLDYSIRMWPGSPARPYEEQIWMDILKKRMFAMMMEYNLYET